MAVIIHVDLCVFVCVCVCVCVYVLFCLVVVKLFNLCVSAFNIHRMYGNFHLM